MPKYRFDQIAINSTAKKKPVEDDKYTYIGLEHLDTGSLKVSRWGSDVAPIGEKLLMKQGDVLFGKRRAYQKKVAIAPFDGIFSAHGMVLRPREDVVDKDFFPMFISSDYFLDAAIKISVGSLSPTINWKDLAKLEFELPDLKMQRRMAEVLWSIEDTCEAYKTLLSKTSELEHARFTEMFGDFNANPFGLRRLALKDINEYKNTTVNPANTPDVIFETYSVPSFDTGHPEYLLGRDIASTKLAVEKDDVLLCKINPRINRVWIVADESEHQSIASSEWIVVRTKEIMPEFLLSYFRLPQFQELMVSEVTGIAGSLTRAQPKKVAEYPVLIPPLVQQEEYVRFYKQSELSMQSLKKSLSEARALQKKVLKENLKVSGKEN